MIRIVISGIPVAKKSTKFFFSRGKFGGKNTQAKLMGQIKEKIRWQYTDEPLSGPIAVNMILYVPYPKSLSKKKIEELKKETTYSCKKSDNDNFEKLYFDCLKGLVFNDDGQISQNFTMKIYSAQPRVEFYIQKLEEKGAEPQKFVNFLQSI